MSLKDQVILEFDKRFHRAPDYLISSPGRVNLIGEHTDYNQGFVLPMAINRAIWVALRAREDHQVVAYSHNLDETLQFDLKAFSKKHADWGEYVKGVAWALQVHGYDLSGWEGVIAGDIPIGAGLSSSAALELAAVRAFEVVSGFDWEPVEMAKLAQRAENDWVGVNCGIMDQLIVAVGKKGCALKIDCRSLEFEEASLPDGLTVVVIDSSTPRGLMDSAYNERRQQCEQAAQHFGAASLRDVTLEELRAATDALDPTIFKRAKHVLTENQRVEEAFIAMRDNDPATLGMILQDGHASLRDDFEVSRAEIDTLVGIANSHPGCYGSRMTGAGFGGCVVCLLQDDAVGSFTESVHEGYLQVTGLEATCYVTTARQGVKVEKLGR